MKDAVKVTEDINILKFDGTPRVSVIVPIYNTEILGITFYRIKESFKTERHYIFGVIPFVCCKKSKGVI